jgi:hypothetical protein
MSSFLAGSHRGYFWLSFGVSDGTMPSAKPEIVEWSGLNDLDLSADVPE